MNTIISLFDAKLLLIAYLVLMNLIALIAFGADKHKAEKRVFRTPESVLLTLAVIGGAAGALAGMYLFHHKTRKPRFRIGIPLILIVQLVLAALLYVTSAEILFL